MQEKKTHPPDWRRQRSEGLSGSFRQSDRSDAATPGASWRRRSSRPVQRASHSTEISDVSRLLSHRHVSHEPILEANHAAASATSQPYPCGAWSASPPQWVRIASVRVLQRWAMSPSRQQDTGARALVQGVRETDKERGRERSRQGSAGGAPSVRSRSGKFGVISVAHNRAGFSLPLLPLVP